MQVAQIVHGVVAVLFVAAMLGHIYIGTIGMEGAFEGDVGRHGGRELGQGAPQPVGGRGDRQRPCQRPAAEGRMQAAE